MVNKLVSSRSSFARRPLLRTVCSLAFAVALIAPAIAYADYYETSRGDFTVDKTTNGTWKWTSSNGEGGIAPTKRDAKKAAKESLKKKPTKGKKKK